MGRRRDETTPSLQRWPTVWPSSDRPAVARAYPLHTPPTPPTPLTPQAMCRVLFIYAKLNPGIKYVQGMNELLAPLYYVFATGRVRGWVD